MSPGKKPANEKQSRMARRHSREARRSRFLLVGGTVLSLVVLGAWFPANALYHQHSSLASATAQLNELHREDAALAQERKNLSNSTEIARIAREQDQLVSPGQQAYEVLPPTEASTAGSPYAGDPARKAPVSPSSASVLPPSSVTATTQPSATSKASTTMTRKAAPKRGMLDRMLGALEFWN